MLRRDGISLGLQPVPEAFVGLHWFAGIQTFQEKFLQFLLAPLEIGSGGNLHRGDRGLKGLFSGTIRTGIHDGPDSLFLLWGEL